MATSYNLRTRQKQHSPSSKQQNKSTNDPLTKQSPKTAHKQPTTKMISRIGSQKIISVSSNSTLTSTQFLSTHINTNIIVNQYSHVEVNSNSLLDSANIQLYQCKKKSTNFTDDFEFIGGSANREDNVERSGEGSGDKLEDVADSMVLEDSIVAKLPSCYKNYHSVFEEFTQKKQYRGVKHASMVGVPFRKFQTQLEQKIMKQQKNCWKDIEKLFAKIQNAPNKDLKNRYFISGIAIILKLMNQNNTQNFYSQQNRDSCEQIYNNLKKKIQQQLDNIEEMIQGREEHPIVYIKKEKLFNRIYRILRKKFRNGSESRDQLQDKAIELVSSCEGEGGIDIKALFEKVGEIKGC